MRVSVRLWLVLVAGVVGACLVVAPAYAEATSPWWGVNTTARPANLVPGKSATILARVTNIGDATAPAPITITDRLPAGLTAKSVAFYSTSWFHPTSAGGVVGEEQDFGPGGSFAFLELCKIGEAGRLVTCTWPGVAELEAKGMSKAQAEEEFAHVSNGPLFSRVLVDPFVGYFQVKIPVKVAESAVPGLENEIRVSGGGAPLRHEATPLHISKEPVRFGVEDYEMRPEEAGGALDTRAGSHPFQITTYLSFNQTAEKAGVEELNSWSACPRISVSLFPQVSLGGSPIALNAPPRSSPISVPELTALRVPAARRSASRTFSCLMRSAPIRSPRLSTTSPRPMVSPPASASTP
jgi:uncharacterized repeat protein (TIGR01451 family)